MIVNLCVCDTTHLSIRALSEPLSNDRSINQTIKDNVSDMNPLWSKFTGQRLTERSEGKFGRGERGQFGATSHGSCRAREQQRSTLSFEHVRNHGLREIERAVEIECEARFQIVFFELEEGLRT